MVVYLMGWVLNIEAFLMLLPCAFSLLYRDGCLRYFLPVIAAGWLAGWLCVRRKPKNTGFLRQRGHDLRGPGLDLLKPDRRPAVLAQRRDSGVL